MMIAGEDRLKTLKLRKRIKRKDRQNEFQTGQQSAITHTELDVPSLPLQCDYEASTTHVESNNSEYEGEDVLNETGKRKRKKSNLSAVAQVCDRAGVSDRTAALLSTSLLLNIGHINNRDQNAVIDRHKIRRERSKLRKNFQKCIDAELDDPFALYFDGRIDKMLKNINKDCKCSKSLISEEHICLLQEPHHHMLVMCRLRPALLKTYLKRFLKY